MEFLFLMMGALLGAVFLMVILLTACVGHLDWFRYAVDQGRLNRKFLTRHGMFWRERVVYLFGYILGARERKRLIRLGTPAEEIK